VLTLAPWVGVAFLRPAEKRAPVSSTALSQTLAELNAGQAEPNDAIIAKARSLVEGAATNLDKIRVVGKFTQQLNYVSIQVNIAKGGGYRPHAAAEFFQKLYGDCKDKANLTRAMSKAVGMTAYSSPSTPATAPTCARTGHRSAPSTMPYRQFA
jgi:hypothetical protein